jgi:taurine dioxygenase
MKTVERALSIAPMTGRIGAEITGVDLSQPLDPNVVAEIRHALLDYLVVFFREQDITTDQQLAFAACFGPVAIPGFVSQPDQPMVNVLDTSISKGYTDSWHADDTWMEEPPLGAVLRAVEVPSSGGDTCFANMYAAYEALSPAMQRFLDSLTAVHSNRPALARLSQSSGITLPPVHEVVHPVVWVHPETGRKLLYVNRNKTTCIVDLEAHESDAVLSMLFDHVKAPEFHCRFRWAPGSIAFWDNRAVLHYAVPDYAEPRIMHRVLVGGGGRPTGPTAQ